jgi:hypothetical protein
MKSTIYTVVQVTSYGACSFSRYTETFVLKAFRNLADAEAFESDCWKTNNPEPDQDNEFTVKEVELEE